MNYPQKKQQLYDQLKNELEQYTANEERLAGLDHPDSLDVFTKQLVDSIRRVNYVENIQNVTLSNLRIDPCSDLFDPLKAASIQIQNNNLDEAFWLVFLATHFGKSKKSGWMLCRDIYGALGERAPWTWNNITNNFI